MRRPAKHRSILLQMAQTSQTWVRMADEAAALNRVETDLDLIERFDPGASGMSRGGAQRQLERPSE